MELHDKVELNIKELDDLHYQYDRFIFLEGINGVIPELHIWLIVREDDIGFDTLTIEFKSDVLSFSTKGFIYERQKLEERVVQLKVYLMSKDMVYKQLPASYKSVDKAIKALNTDFGEDDKIPKSRPEFPCNQMMEQSSEYLTKLYLCLRPNFAFYYGWDQMVHGVYMESTSPDVVISDGDGVNIKDGSISAKYNPLEEMDMNTADITTASVTMTNYHRVGSVESSNAYNNYVSNRSLLNRHNEMLQLSTLNFGLIKTGDLVEIPVTRTLKKKYRAVFRTLEFINHQWSSTITCRIINEDGKMTK